MTNARFSNSIIETAKTATVKAPWNKHRALAKLMRQSRQRIEDATAPVASLRCGTAA